MNEFVNTLCFMWPPVQSTAMQRYSYSFLDSLRTHSFAKRSCKLVIGAHSCRHRTRVLSEAATFLFSFRASNILCFYRLRDLSHPAHTSAAVSSLSLPPGSVITEPGLVMLLQKPGSFIGSCWGPVTP